jgi:hypothetical protein
MEGLLHAHPPFVNTWRFLCKKYMFGCWFFFFFSL